MCIPVSSLDGRANHRSADRGDLVVPVSHTATYGKQSFAVADPTAWDALPLHIRQSQNIVIFKA